MRTIYRLIGIGLAILLILALILAGVWFRLNSYIQSDAFRQDLQTQLSAALGSPIQIEKIDFRIFGGIRLHNLSYAEKTPNTYTIKVGSIDCAANWRQLWSMKFELTRIYMHHAEVVLNKDATPTNPAPSTPPATAPPHTEPPSGFSFDFQVDTIVLDDTNVTIEDKNNAILAQLHGLALNADARQLTSLQKITGTVNATQIELPSNRITITGFSTTFNYDKGSVEIKPYDGTVFSGNMAGGYTLAQGGSTLDLNLRGCDVQEILAATQSTIGVSGRLDVLSKWRNVESGTSQSEGDVKLRGGKLFTNQLVRQIGQLLGLKGVDSSLPLIAQSHFVMENEHIRFSDLDANADLFRVTGNGTLGFDKSIQADLVLYLSAEVMKQIRKEIAASFLSREDGSGSISFKVSGTTDNPQTDLPSRLILQNTAIQGVIQNQLDKFLHKKSKKAATPAPETTPGGLTPPADTNPAPKIPLPF